MNRGQRFKIEKEKFFNLLDSLRTESEIQIPKVQKPGLTRYLPWEGERAEIESLFESGGNSSIPLKAQFFPAYHEMFSFSRDKEGVKLTAPEDSGKRQIIVGARSCDLTSLEILDKVFLDGYIDPYYQKKREETILIGVSCRHIPYSSCFCRTLGIDPDPGQLADITLREIDDRSIFVEINSQKGSDLFSGLEMVEEEGEAGEIVAATSSDLSPFSLDKEKESLKAGIVDINLEKIRERLDSIFSEVSFWEEISAKCISCGICTFLCPTCHCFDINDLSSGERGVRIRSWDSCSFPLYTRMPMENPRAEKWRRVRQRIYHKFLYFPLNFGKIACTGCGRCIRSCPVKWDILETLKTIEGKVL